MNIKIFYKNNKFLIFFIFIAKYDNKKTITSSDNKKQGSKKQK